MEIVYRDIPILYTAISEWLACIVFILLLEKRFHKKIIMALCVFALPIQFGILKLTGILSIDFWIPCMILAAIFMMTFIFICCNIKFNRAVCCGAIAFIMAEFMASLEWQIIIFLEIFGASGLIVRIPVLILVYTMIFISILKIEKNKITRVYLDSLRIWDIISIIGIAIATFAISNISFLISRQMIGGFVQINIFTMRTLADFTGLSALYALQTRTHEYLAEQETKSIQAMLKTQYDQYRSYRQSLEYIRLLKHDIKSQLNLIRAETDIKKREEWIDLLEEGLHAAESPYHTNNRVLDDILESKIEIMRKHKINFTCVADGTLLEILHVTDICTIFGNALDNAIESAILIEEFEKRIIDMSVVAKKNFVLIQIRNYFENKLEWNRQGELKTTKADKKSHGYGIKSIRYSIEKYNGIITIEEKSNWFKLSILIPRS